MPRFIASTLGCICFKFSLRGRPQRRPIGPLLVFLREPDLQGRSWIGPLAVKYPSHVHSRAWRLCGSRTLITTKKATRAFNCSRPRVGLAVGREPWSWRCPLARISASCCSGVPGLVLPCLLCPWHLVTARIFALSLFTVNS